VVKQMSQRRSELLMQGLMEGVNIKWDAPQIVDIGTSSQTGLNYREKQNKEEWMSFDIAKLKQSIGVMKVVDHTNAYETAAIKRDKAKMWLADIGSAMIQFLPEWTDRQARITIPMCGMLGFDHNTMHGGSPHRGEPDGSECELPFAVLKDRFQKCSVADTSEEEFVKLAEVSGITGEMGHVTLH